MLEIPEASVMARQLNQTVWGKRIETVVAARSPHRFAFFHGDPQGYDALLAGQTVTGSRALGGLIEVAAGPQRLLFGDGVNLRYHAPAASRPDKHQLLVGFSDGAALSATVAMYGLLACFADGTYDNPYYLVALALPSPLSDAFDRERFAALLAAPGMDKLSVKAFLATEQRIPGLGNGVLQDILWSARLHPRRKVGSLDLAARDRLFTALRDVLRRMESLGGRDTESDLFGRPGGYPTVMSRLHVGEPCPACGATILKAAYLGGSIYVCPACQPS